MTGVVMASPAHPPDVARTAGPGHSVPSPAVVTGNGRSGRRVHPAPGAQLTVMLNVAVGLLASDKVMVPMPTQR